MKMMYFNVNQNLQSAEHCLNNDETNLNLKKIKYNFDNNGFIVIRNFFNKEKN